MHVGLQNTYHHPISPPIKMATIPTRDLEAARKAYASGDLEASKMAHNLMGHSEVHTPGGDHLKVK